MNLLKMSAMLLVLGLAFAACTGDDSTGDSPTPTGTPEATASEEPDLETAAPTETEAVETSEPTEEPAVEPTKPSSGEEPFVINAGDFFFNSPGARGAVLEGETVLFRLDNIGQLPHTLTFYRDAGYTDPIAGADSGTVAGGSSAEVTVAFGAAGSYFFRCEIHPETMQGGIDAIEGF